MAEVISIANTGGCGCGSGSGSGDKYYSEAFVDSLGFTIGGNVHDFSRIPDVTIYDPSGELILAHLQINYTNFNVTVSFNRLQSGTIILT